MPAIKLEDVNRLQNEEVDIDVLDFLELFEEGKPLQSEPFNNWREECSVSSGETKSIVAEAIRLDFVIDSPEGLRRTKNGDKKTTK